MLTATVRNLKVRHYLKNTMTTVSEFFIFENFRRSEASQNRVGARYSRRRRQTHRITVSHTHTHTHALSHTRTHSQSSMLLKTPSLSALMPLLLSHKVPPWLEQEPGKKLLKVSALLHFLYQFTMNQDQNFCQCGPRRRSHL